MEWTDYQFLLLSNVSVDPILHLLTTLLPSPYLFQISQRYIYILDLLLLSTQVRYFKTNNGIVIFTTIIGL